MVFLLSLVMMASVCNAGQGQPQQRHVTVGNIVILVLGALVGQHDQPLLYASFGAKRIKLASGYDDAVVQVDVDDSPLEKIWHYNDSPKMFDRFRFDDDMVCGHQAMSDAQPTISKQDREFERLACLQRLSKRMRKQKKLAQQVVAIKTPKNQTKRAAHHQHQPIKKCQKR